MGQVLDIIDGILLLESSLLITGDVLHIDGGQIAGTDGHRCQARCIGNVAGGKASLIL